MKKQNAKMRKMIFTLVVSGLCLSVVPIVNSASKIYSNQRNAALGKERLLVPELSQVAKPRAGRNRHRLILPVILPTNLKPRVNADGVSSPISNLQANVLSSDNGSH